jgi:hypothetical protein
LFAGDQVLLGSDLARLLGLDVLGNRTGGECGVGAGLVFAAVGRADAGTCAELGRDLDALAGGVQPRGGVAQGIWVRASADAWTTRLICCTCASLSAGGPTLSDPTLSSTTLGSTSRGAAR